MIISKILAFFNIKYYILDISSNFIYFIVKPSAV